MSFPEVLSSIALGISVGALVVSFLAYRQARNTASLSSRREAINHVRAAVWDVTLDGNITARTVASVREALQISRLVFSNRVIAQLDQAHGVVFRLQHRSFDQLTDQDDADKELLEDQLNKILNAMNEEARL